MRTRSNSIIHHICGLIAYVTAIFVTYHLTPLFYIIYDMASGGSCGYSQLKEYPSPDSTKKIVVSLFDCGATTGYSTQISLHDADEVMQQEKPIYGNTDLGERIHDRTVAVYGKEVEVRVNWNDNQHVTLGYAPENREVLNQLEEQMDGVTIQAVPEGSN